MDENKIIAFLQGKLSDEERQQVISELRDNPEHFELFITLKQIWALTDKQAVEHYDIDVNKEFKTFKYRNLDTETTPISKPNIFLRNFLKVAAIFIFAFGLSYLFFVSTNNNPTINLPQAIGFNEIVTKAGEKSQITLADGSVISINSCTKLRYPANVSQNEIEFKLDGEAYFDFKKLPNRKICIQTSQIKIKVIGTAFNLKAYSNDNNIVTTLVRGKIAIENNSDEDQAPILLKPNQSATYFKNNNEISVEKLTESRVKKVENFDELERISISKKSNLIVLENLNPLPDIAWKDGKMCFKKENFESLAKKMERWFNTHISINDPKLKKVSFTGTFDKETIEQALQALSYPVPFSYKIKKDSVIINSKTNIN